MSSMRIETKTIIHIVASQAPAVGGSERLDDGNRFAGATVPLRRCSRLPALRTVNVNGPGMRATLTASSEHHVVHAR
jgi:hypothetical protein